MHFYCATQICIACTSYGNVAGWMGVCHSLYCIKMTKPIVRSLYLSTFQAIVAIGVVYVIAPPTWEDLTHLALSGLVDSSNEV